jgi:hypothetical protein
VSAEYWPHPKGWLIRIATSLPVIVIVVLLLVASIVLKLTLAAVVLSRSPSTAVWLHLRRASKD